MISLSRTHLSGYVAAIFVAGAVTGGVLGWRKAQVKSPPVSVEKACMTIEDRLKAKLQLSPKQIKKIQPILDQSSHEIRKLDLHMLKEVNAILCRRDEQISRFLSPEQLEKLTEWDPDRCEWIQKMQRSQSKEN